MNLRNSFARRELEQAELKKELDKERDLRTSASATSSSKDHLPAITWLARLGVGGKRAMMSTQSVLPVEPQPPNEPIAQWRAAVSPVDPQSPNEPLAIAQWRAEAIFNCESFIIECFCSVVLKLRCRSGCC